MTSLRQRMTEDMQLRGLAPATQQAYLRYVEQLALFIGKSPDLATDEDFRQFFLALHDVNGSTGNIVSRCCSVHRKAPFAMGESASSAVRCDVRRRLPPFRRQRMSLIRTPGSIATQTLYGVHIAACILGDRRSGAIRAVRRVRQEQ